MAFLFLGKNALGDTLFIPCVLPDPPEFSHGIAGPADSFPPDSIENQRRNIPVLCQNFVIAEIRSSDVSIKIDPLGTRGAKIGVGCAIAVDYVDATGENGCRCEIKPPAHCCKRITPHGGKVGKCVIPYVQSYAGKD
jgi:hypothetical protein